MRRGGKTKRLTARDEKRHRTLARWVNSVLNGRWTHIGEGTLPEDCSDSMVLVHVTSVVLDFDVLNQSPNVRMCVKKNVSQAMRNISECIKLFAARGLPIPVLPDQITGQTNDAAVTMLLLMARFFYRKRISFLSKSTNTDFNDTLLKCIGNLLKDFHDPIIRKCVEIELGFLAIIHYYPRNFTDGFLMCALASKLDDKALPIGWTDLKDLDAHDRWTFVLETVRRHMKVPPLLDARDVSGVPDGDCVGLYLAAVFYANETTAYNAEKAYLDRRMLLEAVKTQKEAVVELEKELKTCKLRLSRVETQADHDRAEAAAQRAELESTIREYRLRQGEARAQYEDLKEEAAAVRTTSKWRVIHQQGKVKRLASAVEDLRLRLESEENSKTELGLQLAEYVDRLQEAEVRLANHGSTPHLRRQRSSNLSLDKGLAPTSRLCAPLGIITIMFTDVQGSTSQWEADPDTMAVALHIHNVAIRKALEGFGGYEVKTEGDAFMVAFQAATDAVQCALAIQMTLLEQEWPDLLFDNPESREEFGPEGELLWRGLRVRIGLHTGTPRARPDPVTGRMDYFGQMVNRAARVEGFTRGGQIIGSQAVLDELPEGFVEEIGYEAPGALGEVHLKGLRDGTHLFEFTPTCLKNRKFQKNKKSAQKDLRNISAAASRAEKDAEALETSLRHIRGRTFGLQQEAAKFAGNVTAIQVQPGGLFAVFQQQATENLAALQDEMALMVKEMDSIRNHNDGLTEDVQMIRESVSSATEVQIIATKDNALKQAHESLQVKTQQLDDAIREINSLRRQAQDAHREQSTLRAEVRASHRTSAAVKSLEVTGARHVATIADLTRDLEAVKGELGKILEEVKSKTARIACLEEEAAEHRRQAVAAMCTENGNMDDPLSDQDSKPEEDGHVPRLHLDALSVTRHGSVLAARRVASARFPSTPVRTSEHALSSRSMSTKEWLLRGRAVGSDVEVLTRFPHSFPPRPSTARELVGRGSRPAPPLGESPRNDAYRPSPRVRPRTAPAKRA